MGECSINSYNCTLLTYITVRMSEHWMEMSHLQRLRLPRIHIQAEMALCAIWLAFPNFPNLYPFPPPTHTRQPWPSSVDAKWPDMTRTPDVTCLQSAHWCTGQWTMRWTLSERASSVQSACVNYVTCIMSVRHITWPSIFQYTDS